MEPQKFRPQVDVLCQQPLRLQPPDTSQEAIADRFPGLMRAHAICVTGSTARGWSNQFSDIDIFAFSEDLLDLPVDETSEQWPGKSNGITWQRWIGRFGDQRVDLKVWPLDVMTRALGPCLDGEPEFYNEAPMFHDIVYRTTIGMPVKNANFFEDANAMLRRSSFNRSVARLRKATAENGLTDVAGQLAAGDFASARATARIVADLVADMCLILAGDICTGPKWLMRRLESTPACGISPAEYRSYVIRGELPDEDDRAYASRLARWAQSHIVRIEPQVLTTK